MTRAQRPLQLVPPPPAPPPAPKRPRPRAVTEAESVTLEQMRADLAAIFGDPNA